MVYSQLTCRIGVAAGLLLGAAACCAAAPMPLSHDDRPDHRYPVIHRFAHGEGWAPASGMDEAPHRYAVIHRFDYRSEGWQPVGGLVQDRDGNLYGMNRNSSHGYWYTKYDRGCGLIYRVAPDGHHSTLYDFAVHPQGRGCRVWGELLLDSGALLGVTLIGGRYGHGTVFRLTYDGRHQVLHHFTGADGDLPSSGLVRGPDGALYGVTELGGTFGQGTVYKIGVDGQFRSLYSFRNGDPLGQQPQRELAVGSDGMLYGVADFGPYGHGTVFRLTTDGEASLVYAFSGRDGDLPIGLTLGQDGWLYGGTLAGGAYALGNLFRLSTDGDIEQLHSFNGVDGATPTDRPVQSADGTWYGTTTATAPLRSTLYRTRFDGGHLAVLHAFSVDQQDGSAPVGILLIGRDGGIYGATGAGGSQVADGFGAGTVYRQGP